MVIKTILNLKLYHPTCKAYRIIQSHVEDTVLISHFFIRVLCHTTYTEHADYNGKMVERSSLRYDYSSKGGMTTLFTMYCHHQTHV